MVYFSILGLSYLSLTLGDSHWQYERLPIAGDFMLSYTKVEVAITFE